MQRLCLLFLLVSSPVCALVVTEIMYNPPGTEENLEWIEIYNEKAAPEDLSGYRFTAGIHFVFPADYQPNGRPLAALAPRQGSVEGQARPQEAVRSEAYRDPGKPGRRGRAQDVQSRRPLAHAAR